MVGEVSDEETDTNVTSSGRWRRTLTGYGLLLLVTSAVIVLDQITKWYVDRHLALGESWMPVDAIYPIFRLTHVHNTGAAFGIFPEGGMVFLVIALVVSLVILFYYHQLPDGALLIRLGLGMQLGGALGNVIDRVRLGYVIDFFHVDFWPVFNVADSAIVVGVALLGFELLRDEWRASRTRDPQDDRPPRDAGQSPEERRFSR